MRFWASHMCTFLDVYFAAVKKIKNEALNTNSYQAMTEEYFFLIKMQIIVLPLLNIATYIE